MTCAGSVETVFPGRANPIDIELTDNDQAIEHGDITRVSITFDDAGSTVIDSATQPIVFDWESNPYLSIRLGLANSPSVPEGTSAGTLTIYDANNPAGIQWKRQLLVYTETPE